MMLKVGEYNLIVEGGFLFSGAIVAFLASVGLPKDLPPVLFPLILIAAGTVVGAVCGLIPALLNVKWKANVVVITIMLNYVLTFASTYVLRFRGHAAGTGYGGRAGGHGGRGGDFGQVRPLSLDRAG